MHLKMSSVKWRPFCLSLNVLKPWIQCLNDLPDTVKGAGTPPPYQQSIFCILDNTTLTGQSGTPRTIPGTKGSWAYNPYLVMLCSDVINNDPIISQLCICHACATTAQLSWHMQNCDMTGSLDSKLQKIDYHQTSNVSCTLVGSKIVAHSDVVGALPVGTAPTTSSFST